MQSSDDIDEHDHFFLTNDSGSENFKLGPDRRSQSSSREMAHALTRRGIVNE